MPLAPGARLGPYEIAAAIGAGGMGEVYRARDTRLDRTVAIKVLPEHLARDPERRQRFEREARAVASLNHPHICALYDVGQQDGIDFLVMEYLEGENLAQRLERGPLPVEQVVRYGVQIADALDKAHRKDLTHRDLKPGNIMLTKSGAKLLDFGLARVGARVGAGGRGPGVGEETLSRQLTHKGTIVGTFQYMAPEQLEGQEADARSDIFALGAVLYEMVAGRKAFTGKNQTSVIAAILSADPPPLSTLQPLTPPELERVVKLCLAKDPEERWQSAHEIMVQLQWLGPSPQSPPRPSPRSRPARLLAAVTTLAALAFAIAYFRRPAPEVRAVKLALLPPAKASFRAIAVSPDGRLVAFVQSDRRQLWIRSLDSASAQPLAGTEGADYPFWSPDSRYVGFFAQGKLKKIEASGGPPQTLGDAPIGRGGAWNRDGVILFPPLGEGPLYRVQAAGGEAKAVTSLDQSRQENSHRWPSFLPDGRHFVYCNRSAVRENNGIYLGALEGQDKRRLLGDDSNVVYAPPSPHGGPGHLLFARAGVPMAQPFDAEKLQLAGEAFPVADQVGYDVSRSWGAFSVSENGVLVYSPTSSSPSDQLTWFSRDGTRLGSVGSPGAHGQPWLSPDEKAVVVDQLDPQAGASDLWLIDLSRDISSRFTFDPKNEQSPAWSPDGSLIVFTSDRGGPYNLYQKLSTGAGQEEPLQKSASAQMPDDWSRDGRFLLYRALDPKTRMDLWVLPLVGDRKPIPVLRTEFNEVSGRFSPDGKWIAYVSDESRKNEVYVQSFPLSGGKWRISTNGGRHPRWRRDGKEMFYLAADHNIMAVEIKAGATFQAGSPRALFETRIPDSLFAGFAVTGDGQRFLAPTLLGETAPSPAVVVLNWTAGIRR